MKIGLIGKGKMGADVFNFFLISEHRLVWICRREEDAYNLQNIYQKKLAKSFKRGLLSEKQYKHITKSLVISTDLNEIKNCQLIIESVVENKTIKRNLFNRISQVVDKDCIITTNTSSIPLRDIFYGIEKNQRCFGLHFFYPSQIFPFVEISRLKQSSEEDFLILKNLIESYNKKILELNEEGHGVLNRIYGIMSSQSLHYFNENHLTSKEIDELITNKLFHLGIFSSMDGIGLDIVLEVAKNNLDKRNESLLIPAIEILQSMITKGYMGTKYNKGFYDYDEVNNIVTQDDEDRYKSNIVNSLKHLFINEAYHSVNKGHCNKSDLGYSLKQFLGIDPFELANEMGTKNVNENLTNFYKKNNMEVYNPVRMN